MATFESNQVKKLLRARGNHSGVLTSVTGRYAVEAGDSFALATDAFRILLMGENTRLSRLVLRFIPTSGTPVLTNPVFDVGVEGATSSTYTDSRQNTYAVPATDVDQFGADLTLDTDLMATDVEIARAVADSVSNYAPFYITLTPSGVGAFSVAGGNGFLELTAEYVGLEDEETVYDEYVNQKVSN